MPIVQYLQGERSGSLKEMARIEARARLYYLIGGILYRKTFLPMDAKCLSKQAGGLVLREGHEGGCAENPGARSLARKVMRSEFYWPTMKEDAIQLVRKCKVCQKHEPLTHIPAADMIYVSPFYPFAQWGIDIVCPSLW